MIDHIDEIRPFELLKLIRDRVVKNRSMVLRLVSRSDVFMQLESLFHGLQLCDWIRLKACGEIEPTERIFEVQRALGLSLSRLAPYGRDSVVVNPLFGRPSASSSPADLFVLMPFAEGLKPVYEDHIRPVAGKVGLSVARADDFFGADSIISDVWNAINKAKLLIADCTNRNPNVFYELGIAHTLGKTVILMAQSKDDIPFDVQHIRTIIYTFDPRGMRKFESTLEATLLHELEKPQTLLELLEKTAIC